MQFPLVGHPEITHEELTALDDKQFELNAKSDESQRLELFSTDSYDFMIHYNKIALTPTNDSNNYRISISGLQHNLSSGTLSRAKATKELKINVFADGNSSGKIDMAAQSYTLNFDARSLDNN